MALGVLNNLSAIYAENNLNNTNSSLQTVLQQLSSGSRINSGADDAAGLSLVNGLEANSSALTQSETNATEGVGLLEVADGALSQVTSLLNRAITLATEASNGTLNSTQESAANQEYQSILAEVNNIGSTTTYNQQQVFTGNTVAIYTGDSSTAGSSIDDLNIHALSESSVGDTNGVMSYSNGQDNVFIDLSNAGQNAAITDSLGASTATTTINVSYMSKGANGAAVSSSAAISVGAGTSYANTAQGLISAINNSGLGLNATFTTAAQAGSAAVATATSGNNGTGGATDTGIEISGAGIGTGTDGVGVVGTLTLGGSSDTLGGTLSIMGSDGTSHTVNLGKANSTDTLANLAATINAAGYGVTASLNTVAVNGHAAGTVLTFTSADSNVTVSGTSVTDTTPSIPASTTISASNLGSLTVTAAADKLTGTLTGVEGDGTTPFSISLNGMTLAQLQQSFSAGGANAGLGITASLNTGGTPNTILTFAKASGDASTPSISISGSSITDANVTAPSIDTSANTGTQIGTLTVTSAGDTLTGTLTGIEDDGTTSFSIDLAGQNIAQISADFATGGSYASYGLTATVGGADNNVLTFTSSGGTGSGVVGATGTSITDTNTTSPTVASATALGTLTVGKSSDTLSGTLSGVKADGSTPFSIDLDGMTLSELQASFAVGGANAGLGITAAISGSGNNVLQFTSTGGADKATIGNSGNLTDSTVPVLVSTGFTNTPTTGTPNSTTLGSLSIASSDTLSGSLVIGANTIAIGATNNTGASLASAINKGDYGVTATYDSTSGALTFTSANSSMTVNSSSLEEAVGSGTPAAVGAVTGTAVTASQYYSLGISGSIEDTSTAVTVNGATTYGGTGNVGITTDLNGETGIATTSYTDDAGISLKGTDLLNQSDAETALTSLNTAITDVAAQDGYIGAEINTLNSISQVMSTQQENVVSAQNAIQATDYASATSNMSKYEILSQTGIAALAQANSVQQEVTKLLQ
jgi:flagellin